MRSSSTFFLLLTLLALPHDLSGAEKAETGFAGAAGLDSVLAVAPTFPAMAGLGMRTVCLALPAVAPDGGIECVQENLMVLATSLALASAEMTLAAAHASLDPLKITAAELLWASAMVAFLAAEDRLVECLVDAWRGGQDLKNNMT